jgi:hypothetical protein
METIVKTKKQPTNKQVQAYLDITSDTYTSARIYRLRREVDSHRKIMNEQKKLNVQVIKYLVEKINDFLTDEGGEFNINKIKKQFKKDAGEYCFNEAIKIVEQNNY